MEAGANVHCRDKGGNTPLQIAIARGNDRIAELLIQKGSNVNATNKQGIILERILERAVLEGGQIRAVDELGSTPLHLAVLSNNVWMVKAPLKHGSDLEAVDYKGSTPLHVGCCSGNKEGVSVMIDHGR